VLGRQEDGGENSEAQVAQGAVEKPDPQQEMEGGKERDQLLWRINKEISNSVLQVLGVVGAKVRGSRRQVRKQRPCVNSPLIKGATRICLPSGRNVRAELRGWGVQVSYLG
jgi:hypothetical protein